MPPIRRTGIMGPYQTHATGPANGPQTLDGEETAMRTGIVKAISLAALYLVLQLAALAAVTGLWTATS